MIDISYDVRAEVLETGRGERIRLSVQPPITDEDERQIVTLNPESGERLKKIIGSLVRVEDDMVANQKPVTMENLEQLVYAGRELALAMERAGYEATFYTNRTAIN